MPAQFADYFQDAGDLQHFLDWGIHFYRNEDHAIPARFLLILRHWVSAHRSPKTANNRRKALEINPTRNKTGELISQALNHLIRKEKHLRKDYPIIKTVDSEEASSDLSLFNLQEGQEAISDMVSEAISLGDTGFFREVTNQMDKRHRTGKKMLTEAGMLRQGLQPPRPHSSCLAFLENCPVIDPADWPGFLEAKVYTAANGHTLAAWGDLPDRKDPHYERLGRILETYEILSFGQRKIPSESELLAYFDVEMIPNSQWARSLKTLGLDFLIEPKKRGRPAIKKTSRRTK